MRQCCIGHIRNETKRGPAQRADTHILATDGIGCVAFWTHSTPGWRNSGAGCALALGSTGGHRTLDTGVDDETPKSPESSVG
jgi:hypothetical protein